MNRFPNIRIGDGPLHDSTATTMPKVNGVGRDPGHDRAITVYFDRKLSDDELRALHEFLRAFSGGRSLRDRIRGFGG